MRLETILYNAFTVGDEKGGSAGKEFSVHELCPVETARRCRNEPYSRGMELAQSTSNDVCIFASDACVDGTSK